MFIGHFGAGLAGKRFAPAVSLGTLLLAAQFIDLLWPTFLLLGWEDVRIEPGALPTVPLVFEHYPLSHSLVAVIAWAALLGAIVRWRGHRPAAAWTVAVLVLSHWLLDALVHVPDLPLAPAGAARVGLGLWTHPAVEAALELAIFALGAALYLRATRPCDRIGTWALVGLLVVLLLVHLANAVGEPPPSVTAIAWVGEAQWLLVAWGYWIDRHRRPRGEGEPPARAMPAQVRAGGNEGDT